jgi:hypothetical protein
MRSGPATLATRLRRSTSVELVHQLSGLASGLAAYFSWTRKNLADSCQESLDCANPVV